MSRHRPRSDATTPRSAHWTLYKSDLLAAELGVTQEDLDEGLEKYGFAKAVRIREDLIRWKCNLKFALHERAKTIEACDRARTILVEGQNNEAETLAQVRDLLRIPRENPKGWPPKSRKAAP